MNEDSDRAEEPTDGDADTPARDDPGSSVEVQVVDEAEISAREAAALRRVRSVSWLLDDAVRLPGTDFRFGLDPVLGVLPGAGSAVAAAISLYPIAEAYRLDTPRWTVARMLALVAVDAVVGSIPFLGPVFDAFWKANEWNRRALERHLERSR